MPRRQTADTAGMVFHAMNRGARKLRLFEHDSDYRAFRETISDVITRAPVHLYAYCIMPNHFHLVCSPRKDGQLSQFMRLLTLTHSKRWHAARGTTGTGCVYQGRFRSFPVQSDNHFLTICRYVERNPLRAGLVKRAEDWRWSSLSDRCKECHSIKFADWPTPTPGNWIDVVNDVEAHAEAVRTSIRRGRPFGDERWVAAAAARLGLQGSVGAIGRPWS